MKLPAEPAASGASGSISSVMRVRGFDEAFVVVEGQGAREIQQALGLASESDTAEELDDDSESDEDAGVEEGGGELDEDDDGAPSSVETEDS